MSKKLTLALDVGTTFSAAALSADGQEPTVFSYPNDGDTVPSLIFIDEKRKKRFGSAARNASVVDPDRLCQFFKRLIKTEPLGPLNKTGRTPHDLIGMLIAYLTKAPLESDPLLLEAYKQGSLEIVVTVPADFQEAEKKLYYDAALKRGVKISGFFAESTAGFIDYRKRCPERLKEGDKILVADLGGGTFDISILQYTNLNADEIACNRGDPQLGGIDFTGETYVHFCGQIGRSDLAVCYQRGQGFDLSSLTNPSDRRHALKIYETAERAKRGLSSTTEVTEFIELGDNLHEVILTTEQFVEAINRENYQRFDQGLTSALDGLQLTFADIDHVLVIGGSSALPRLIEYVAQCTGRQPDDVYCNPQSQHVVCKGAAQLASCGQETAKVSNGGVAIGMRDPQTNEKRFRFFLNPGDRIPAAGTTVECSDQYIESQGGPCTIPLELGEARPGAQIPSANGSLPVVDERLVQVLTTRNATFTLPAGRHVMQLGMSYHGRILRYSMRPAGHPEIEVLSGTLMDESESPAQTAVESFDVILLADTSGSMSGQKIDSVRTALQAELPNYQQAGHRAALITFGTTATIVQPTTNDYSALASAAAVLDTGGGTDMAAGLSTARGIIDSNQSTLVLLWTDGRPNSEPEAIAEAGLLKSCVSRLVTIGIGGDVNENLLRYKIASSPADYYTVDDIQNFATTLHQITELYLNAES